MEITYWSKHAARKVVLSSSTYPKAENKELLSEGCGYFFCLQLNIKHAIFFFFLLFLVCDTPVVL